MEVAQASKQPWSGLDDKAHFTQWGQGAAKCVLALGHGALSQRDSPAFLARQASP